MKPQKIKYKSFLFGCFFLLIIMPSWAQKQANNWYFGDHAGINFNTVPPQPITGGQIETWEGCASISDSLGNLQFYTNGMIIWDKSHQIMQNGTELLGDTSSTESAIIVPLPGSQRYYYIFTVDKEAGANGLCYSIVDMQLNAGKGAVTSTKNIQLLNPVPEKVTAVYHANRKDIWIVSHKWGNSEFYAWLLTENGLTSPPIISDVGTPHIKVEPNPDYIINPLGYMKCSPNGKKLALALLRSSIVELFDFDNITGKLSNPIIFPLDPFATYGIEFSPDCSKLYISANKQIYQANLNAGTDTQIIASLTEIANFATFSGAIQLSTNGKVYVAINNSTYLGVINQPDSIFPKCNFVENGFFLNGGLSRLGLPDFLQSYFVPANFRANGSCTGEVITFNISNAAVFDSVSWDFNDPMSGTQNFSNLTNPSHIFEQSGNYHVVLTQWNNGQAYFVAQNITIFRPNLNFANDTILCPDKTLILNAFSDNCTYLWQDFSVNPTYEISQSGIYFVNLQNQITGCTNADTINVSYTTTPAIFLGNDTSFCANDTFTLSAFHEKYNYFWNTTQTDSVIKITDIGKYFVQITDSLGCKNADTIALSHYPVPRFSLGVDTSICKGSTYRLRPAILAKKYLWQDNSTQSFLDISNFGNYYLTVSDSLNCTFSDTINFYITDTYNFNFPTDTTICYGQSIYFNLQDSTVSFLWQDGTFGGNYEITNSGNYTLLSTNKCGESVSNFNINARFCGEIFIPNIITPNNDHINDNFLIQGISATAWRLKIYSRWGDMVFSSENYQNNWKADCCTEGTYYFILSSNIFKEKYSGWVQVVK